MCGPHKRREKLPANSIKVGDADIPFSESVRSLGVVLDAEMSFKNQVSATVSACNYHLRRIGRVRRCMTMSAANSAAVALVQSKLDYCNSLMYGVNKTQIKRLQVAQNSAARLVTRTKKRDRISPVLRQLHWLKVEKRVQHKLLTITHQAIQKTGPAYLSDVISEYVPKRELRSSSQMLLRIPSVKEAQKKTFGERSFSFTGPKLWEPIPLELKRSESKSLFKSRLKTHLFRTQK